MLASNFYWDFMRSVVCLVCLSSSFWIRSGIERAVNVELAVLSVALVRDGRMSLGAGVICGGVVCFTMSE